jgi:hypothetical protein
MNAFEKLFQNYGERLCAYLQAEKLHRALAAHCHDGTEVRRVIDRELRGLENEEAVAVIKRSVEATYCDTITIDTAVEIVMQQEESRRCAMGVPDAASPANRDTKEVPPMNAQTQTANAVTVVDGFDAAELDRTESPIRGVDTRFKDGDYFNFKEQIDVEGRCFAVFDLVAGWQKLEKDSSPQYLMQKAGEPKPAQPHVEKADWPLNFDDQPEHPWKWTRYLYLLDTATGEISTFSSSTIGGRIGIDELRDQIAFMRRVRPDAIPIVALQSKDMPTSFGGTKPRPYFKILGWKTRGDVGPQNLLAGPEQKDTFDPATSKELLDDEVPFDDGVPTFGGAT